MSVLLDSSFLIAYSNSREDDHSRAVELAKELETNSYGEKIISDYIFDETITILKKYIGNKKTIEDGTKILDSTKFIKIDSMVFVFSWGLSKKFDHLSFTDCSNIALMKHFSITYLATFDSGFDGLVKVLR